MHKIIRCFYAIRQKSYFCIKNQKNLQKAIVNTLQVWYSNIAERNHRKDNYFNSPVCRTEKRTK